MVPYVCIFLIILGIGMVGYGIEGITSRQRTVKRYGVTYSTGKIKEIEPAPKPPVDYKLIERIEEDLFTQTAEDVAWKAALVAELYMTVNRHQLFDQHPHVVEFGWPPEIPFANFKEFKK